MDIDIRIENHGSIVLLRPVTQDAKDWVEENLQTEDWQGWCGAIAVDPRCVGAIVDGAIGDGLIVN